MSKISNQKVGESKPFLTSSFLYLACILSLLQINRKQMKVGRGIRIVRD